MASVLTTITVKKSTSTATMNIKRMSDGSIVFNDVNGNVVQAHSNIELSKLFEALNALV